MIIKVLRSPRPSVVVPVLGPETNRGALVSLPIHSILTLLGGEWALYYSAATVIVTSSPFFASLLFHPPPLELTEHIACQIANVMELMQRIVRAACKLIIAG